MRAILIIMHNQMMGHMVKRILEEDGYHCHYVRETQDAFGVLENEHLDLIILQANIDNSERFIKMSNAIKPTLPILTACFSDREQNMQLLALTGISPIRIPFSEEQVKAKVHTILAREV